MNLKNVIDSLALTNGSAMFNHRVRIVSVDAYGEECQTLFSGTIQEMINHEKTERIFGAGKPREWFIIGYNFVAYNESDEFMPVFNRPLEIRVI